MLILDTVYSKCWLSMYQSNLYLQDKTLLSKGYKVDLNTYQMFGTPRTTYLSKTKQSQLITTTHGFIFLSPQTKELRQKDILKPLANKILLWKVRKTLKTQIVLVDHLK